MKRNITTLFAVVASAFLAFADDAFPSISTEELKQAIAAKKVVLLDVNGTDSWQGQIRQPLRWVPISTPPLRSVAPHDGVGSSDALEKPGCPTRTPEPRG